jgi:AcrR family transcriptional regulator
MAVRLTRSQRQEQTRAQLLDAALRVFLRRGYHGASLDEIAEEAGYTTGAVYSNFKGKDDLFLAVLDAEAQRRFPLHTELMRQAPSIEDGLRASAREMALYARDHPGWTGVYVEFWTHASRRPELRRRVAIQHERLLDTVGGLVGAWAARWGVEFRLPTREVVRGIYAISRGMGLEALLADEPDSTEQFEEMFLAYAMGLMRAPTGTGTPGEGRLP